jgi:hypothetical protein
MEPSRRLPLLDTAMRLASGRTTAAWVLTWMTLVLAACSTAQYRPAASLDQTQVTERAVSQQQGPYHVRASVPGEEESRRLFGIPVYDRGIQPVWLEVTNHSHERARLTLSSIDPKYFPPFEVAYIHRKRFSKQGWQDLEKHLAANALPRQIAPGQTVSGFVFTNLSNGTKAFNLDIFSASQDRRFEQFTFFIEVPGFLPDHAEVNFESLYADQEIADVDNDGLRTYLSTFSCCSTNRDGSQPGRPVLQFFVGHGLDLLRALLRAGWSETSYERNENYLAGAEYLFGRPPDAIVRKGRDRTTERIELALWLAPVRVEGAPLWVGQFKHAIGRRYAIGEMFLGVSLDPDAGDGRNYILQDLWYSQSLKSWAWSQSGVTVSEDEPRLDFHGNPWFTHDDYRVVIWVSGEPMAMQDAVPILWDRVEKKPMDQHK